jgi:lipopolysaccharide biosynthesis regulator YciM|tara:strand:- start:610 stop:1101 length:492 start_codon:yes stop_codon:yes gene_type:complete
MNKITLHDIKHKYIELSERVENMEGELTVETEYELAINEGERDEKAMAYHSIILSKEAFGSTIDNEIKRLQALKKRNNNLIDRLKNSLLSAVETFGEFTIGTNIFGIRKSERVEIEDVNLLSKLYKTIKVTEQADKIAIKKALKEGKKIKNAYIVEQYNLKIK